MFKWESEGELKNVENNGYTYTFHYPCQSHETCYPYIVDIPPGVYTLECYGGVGGSARISGGKAASTSGTLYLRHQQRLYFHVGAKGLQYSRNLVFGGGGKGSFRQGRNDGSGGGSGGGASDIRVYETDLNSRIMVAGGGGGSEYYPYRDIKGGDAGILNGKDGQTTGSVPVGTGGTQTEGGTGQNNNLKGEFGIGGNSADLYGSGGGGGYYGGAAGSSLYGTVSSGGGGSSFILGYAGCNINKTFSKFIFHNPIISTGYDQEPKIVMTIHPQLFPNCSFVSCRLFEFIIKNLLISCFLICKC